MKKLFGPILLLIVMASCSKEKARPIADAGDCFEEKSYQYNIRPIIESSCKTGTGPGTGCHDAWIDEYTNIVAYIENGSWENEIFAEKTMPPAGNAFDIDSLKDYELDAMRCWILQGYPNN